MDNRSVQEIEAKAFEEGFNAGIHEEQRKYIEAIRTMSDHIKELEDKHWEECRQIALYDDEAKQKRDIFAEVRDGNCGVCSCRGLHKCLSPECRMHNVLAIIDGERWLAEVSKKVKEASK